MAGKDTSHIVQSLAANSLIAVAKGVAAFFTGSGAMLAETLHSAADCGNQVLLLVGVRRSMQPPDDSHPLGYGRVVYFWSFMVALLLFTGGGVFSIYEGVHKLQHHEPVENVGWAVAVLLFSIAIEGGATISNVRELARRKGDKGFVRYLLDTKDIDLVVVFGENSAAVLGLFLALGAIGLASATGDPRWDAFGTLAIGVVLVLVAVFLAREIQSLLVGERADPEIEAAVRAVAAAEPRIKQVKQVITVQQGPGEALIALKVDFAPELTSDAIARTIDEFETAVRARVHEARWIFVEPV